MKNNKIAVSQIKVGAVRKFGKISNLDMVLLIEDIKKNNNIDLVYDMDDLFVELDINEDVELLENDVVSNFFNHFDMRNFVLKKIKFLEAKYTNEKDIFDNFSIPQKEILNGLIYENCIRDDYNDDEHNIKLTKRGELYLFLMNNKGEVEQFIKLIKEHGYSDLLFDVYLLSQDLNKDIEDILKLSNFVKFITDNNKVFWELTEKEYGYKKVRIPINKKR